ncbi:MAG: aspartate ammonia-lyase [Thermoplasmata archaeon]|nr:aspartate ammonia-lyase [Thermoplasmata archaeon]MCI4354002.1 aspartate ammonia-lyase [Thermoplasmata archaeon]
MTEHRTEVDSLGPREVPATAYYGIQTLRAIENFPVSGLTASPVLIRSYALLKLACTRANRELGALDERRARAIETAAQEVADGHHLGDFRTDVFQAGAGTSLHMNVNEVLANRALEILGLAKGDYTEVSPNDHVNRGQSTNDTFPSAAQVAVLLDLGRLRAAVVTLAASLRRKGDEFADVPKAGRTHLKDAMPVTLGAEFRAYASALEHVLEALPPVEAALAEIPLGGSAVGSGINTRAGFRLSAVAEYARLTGLPLRPSRDPFESMQSRWPLGAASGWMRTLAGELVRIANDLRLLSSGPATALDEIRLPEIQPGSSIMPAKVNPSAAECLDMVAFHVIGADLATSLAVQAGQLEINVMMPLAAYEVLFSAEILANYLPVFARTCVDGITMHPEALERYLLGSTAVATVLTPKLGYLKVAELIHTSARTGRSVKDLLIEQQLLTPDEVEAMLGPKALLAMTRPVP